MAVQIESRGHSGRALHKVYAPNAADAVAYMKIQGQASFVDGFTVGGFGIVRVCRWADGECCEWYSDPQHFSWLDVDSAEFVHGGANTLAEAIEARTLL